MCALKAKIPDFCGYAVVSAAIGLMTYTAACAPRAEEQWSSYYYGASPRYERGIVYYAVDADDDYRMPSNMRMTDGDRNLLEDSMHHTGRIPMGRTR